MEEFKLEAKVGETIAFVGPTEAGKSIIINLLSRFYHPEAGLVFIEGEDLRNIPPLEYKKQIAVVLQDTFIFTGTVAENIRYGAPGASQTEVEAAAREVGIHDYIISLPDGYRTQIPDCDGELSGGQKQLIAFARAVLHNPRILILDEAMSGIDLKTEQVIQTALTRLLEGRTAFVIAHRLSTIRKADRIIVVSDGRVLGSGKYEELIVKDEMQSKIPFLNNKS